jgi:hypothetical protein
MPALSAQPAPAPFPALQPDQQQQPAVAADSQQAQQPAAAGVPAEGAAAPVPAPLQRLAAELTAGDIHVPTSLYPGVSWDQAALKWAVHVQHGAEARQSFASILFLTSSLRACNCLQAVPCADSFCVPSDLQVIPCGVFGSEQEAAAAHDRISQQLKASDQVHLRCCQSWPFLMTSSMNARTLHAHPIVLIGLNWAEKLPWGGPML